jgi:hypothetical protein
MYIIVGRTVSISIVSWLNLFSVTELSIEAKYDMGALNVVVTRIWCSRMDDSEAILIMDFLCIISNLVRVNIETLPKHSCHSDTLESCHNGIYSDE